MWSDFLAGYLGFNKQQRNGLLVLVLISFTLLLVRLVYPYFISPGNIVIQNLPLIERQVDSSYKASANFFKGDFNDKKTANLFVFDPNTISMEQLLQLGFKERTATTFLKFRQKGFTFKQKTDLQKVYGISGKFYAQLEPYILIAAKSKQETKEVVDIKASTLRQPRKTQPKLELNTADSLQLLELNGIGPSFAKRILKYRNILGGFSGTEQLKEVYGFTDEMYEKISAYLTTDISKLKKIDLNKDDFKTVNRHPYLSYELTKAIFDWRKKAIITAVNLKDIISDETVYKKLLPYLSF